MAIIPLCPVVIQSCFENIQLVQTVLTSQLTFYMKLVMIRNTVRDILFL